MAADSPIAVLTGDLVGSTDLAPARIDAAFRALRRVAEDVGAWLGEDTRFTRSRGDAWQLCLSRPDLALRTALLLRAALRAEGRDLETRIAIATGPDTPGSGPDLNAATGPVFVASGRVLGTLGRNALMASAGGGPFGAALRLADHISRGWTEVQAGTISIFLGRDPPTRQRAADRLGKSRQAVDSALEAAGYRAIHDALGMIEARSA